MVFGTLGFFGALCCDAGLVGKGGTVALAGRDGLLDNERTLALLWWALRYYALAKHWDFEYFLAWSTSMSLSIE